MDLLPQGLPPQGMFSDIDLLKTYVSLFKESCTHHDERYGITRECLKKLLKNKYNTQFKSDHNITQYVGLLPFVDNDRDLVSSIINTNSWDVYGYKPDTKEYERDGILENQFYNNTILRPSSGEMVVGVRLYYLNLLFNLPQKVTPVMEPKIRVPPIQPVEPPIQPVEPPTSDRQISVSVSPPRHDSVSIAGGDRHKRAQIKAKSSKKRAQKKSTKKRINKNKNKRRTRSRKALK